VTAVEIAELINDLLEINDVAPDDNFFEMGGNSLLALRLMAKLEEQGGAKVSLLDVVRAPTPHRLASLIAARSHPDTNPGATKAE
jgi:aryl carrier-like protein